MGVQPRQRRQTLAHGVSHGTDADPQASSPSGATEAACQETGNFCRPYRGCDGRAPDDPRLTPWAMVLRPSRGWTPRQN